MDDSRFDNLVRTLSAASSPRRSTFGFLAAGLALLGRHDAEDAAAKDCKKIKDKQKRKKCLKKARDQAPTASPSPTPVICGGVTCPAGQLCCPDQRCGPRCCANGRACNVTCCGPNGNDFCCDASRPICICGGCWAAGSVQCPDPGHCCGPLSPKCCGNDHCCADGWECLVGCPGNTCCLGGQSDRCCPDGTPG